MGLRKAREVGFLHVCCEDAVFIFFLICYIYQNGFQGFDFLPITSFDLYIYIHIPCCEYGFDSNSLGIWIAVKTGSARWKKLSHRDGNKKVAFHILPSTKSAPKGKVRGTESLTEAFKRHVKSSSSIVVDEHPNRL